MLKAATDPNQSDAGGRAILGWAAYLACSWTWCIGMFMPVLLVRDFGFWGWVVFIVPNVIGAAAMGWVLRDREASRRLAERHATACRWFSGVTIAFHLFFAAWMIQRLVGGTAVPLVIAAGLALAAWTGRRVGRTLFAAVAGYALSAAEFATFAAGTRLSLGGTGTGQWRDLSGLALVCTFGFALCPYFDLTFHRARQGTTPAAGRLAFGVGFGALFAAMVVFTLWYARWLWPVIAAPVAPRPGLAFGLVAGHLIVQSAFTLAVHVGEMPRALQTRSQRLYAVGLLIAAILVIALGYVTSTPFRFRARDAGEVVYWCFMGFYGLIFPGYAWLCMVPFRRGGAGPSAAKLRVLAAAVAVALPMYWMGFVEGRPVWLLPGVAVMLLSRLAVPRPATAAPVHGNAQPPRPAAPVLAREKE